MAQMICALTLSFLVRQLGWLFYLFQNNGMNAAHILLLAKPRYQAEGAMLLLLFES